VFRDLAGWEQMSETVALKRTIARLRSLGFFETINPETMVFLGCCIEGGQGLATADDRRFLGVLADTAEGQRFQEMRDQLLGQIGRSPVSEKFNAIVAHEDRLESALIVAAADKDFSAFAFPRYLWIISPEYVYSGGLSPALKQCGISGEAHFVPFEKGDRSEGSGTDSAGAKWYRQNPIVIDWSTDAVALLRRRLANSGTGRPRFQNEALWGQAGVAWNTVTSYLRVRLIPADGIFGHKAPVIIPRVQWLDEYSLMALLNSEVVEFLVKTFLGSRMMIEVGHIRHVPVPMLDSAQAQTLSALGRSAVDYTQRGDFASLAIAEAEINRVTKKLYGMSEDENLWVAR
jgi:hypothetical protein